METEIKFDFAATFTLMLGTKASLKLDFVLTDVWNNFSVLIDLMKGLAEHYLESWITIMVLFI